MSELEKTKARGLPLVASGRRYEVYDDPIGSKALVLVKLHGDRIVSLRAPRPEMKLGWKLIEYVVEGLGGCIDTLRMALENRSMMKLAEHLYRRRSRSINSIRTYAVTVHAFCKFVQLSPDEVIESCLTDGAPDSHKVYKVSGLVDRWLGELDASGCSPTSLAVRKGRMRTFFSANGIELSPITRYSLRVIYRDRAPKQEELQKLIEVASLREKAIIAMLATGGFRIGTLLKLKYKHVKEDLEANRTPVHIHVEAEITKGRYADYDTFINEEAAHYLKLYLDKRRRGTEKIPPEVITDESPLFAVVNVKRGLSVKALSYQATYENLFHLFSSTGLSSKRGKMYEVRIHSIRKFFRTQLEALGVPRDYVEYMMGHKLSTYHDVEMKGVEFLRNVYAAANLRIYPKEKASLADVLKEIIRSRGEDPSKYLRTEIIPNADIITPEVEVDVYARAVWEMLRKEVLEGLISTPEVRARF